MCRVFLYLGVTLKISIKGIKKDLENQGLSKQMVGATGIEPVTPTV